MRAAAVCAVVCLILPASAAAAGGSYVLRGGTAAERHTVVSALEASSFNWDLVPGTVSIRIDRDVESDATPGSIQLDANLLDAGTFAWGVVQHEYAHQVDYLLLDDVQRSLLLDRLGGRTWCYTLQTVGHDDYGCERFASTLAWSYWPSTSNCMRPERLGDESSALPPRRFRALLDSLLMPQQGRQRPVAPGTG